MCCLTGNALRRALSRPMAPPPNATLPNTRLPVWLQSGALSVDHVSFYAELYAALKHAMMVPLLDASWKRGGGSGTAEEEEEEVLSSALAADDQSDTRVGGQVCGRLRCGPVPVRGHSRDWFEPCQQEAPGGVV